MGAAEKQQTRRLVDMTDEELTALVRRVIREERDAAPEIMSMEEVARFFGVTTTTVRHWLKSEGFPGKKIGKPWTFKRAEVVAWYEARGQRNGVSVDRAVTTLKRIRGI